MKSNRRFYRALALAGLVGVVGWLLAQVAAAPISPVSLLPSGAILVLETPDLSRIVNDWSNSGEYKRWTGSTAANGFAKSRLGMRLAEVADSYAAGTGFATTLDWLKSVAGAESTLAVYDIGHLEFVYVTRLSAARAAATSFMQGKASFTVRQVEGRTFYVKAVDKGSGHVAFAVSDGLLIAGTRDDLVAGVLEAVAKKARPLLTQEPWFQAASKSQDASAELRMYLLLPALSHDARARAYWIQRNARDWESSAWAIVESRRTATSIEERRVLQRRDAVSAPPAVRGLTASLGLGSGLVRVASAPNEAEVSEWLQARLLAPGIRPSGSSKQAPMIASIGAVGSESDLETMIDVPPPTLADARLDLAALNGLWRGRRLLTLVTWDGAQANADGILLHLRPAMAVEADADWDSTTVNRLLTAALSRRFTAGPFTWANQARVNVAQGAIPLAWATRGHWLFVGADAAEVNRLFDAQWGADNGATTYAARLQFDEEAPRFTILMSQLDEPALRAVSGDDRQPLLFSETIASLLRVGERVQRVDVQEDAGTDRVTQRVTYSFQR